MIAIVYFFLTIKKEHNSLIMRSLEIMGKFNVQKTSDLTFLPEL